MIEDLKGSPLAAGCSSFVCVDCGADTAEIAEFYMVRNDVWRAAGMTRAGMLCIGCIEARLGRRLSPADFSGASLNRPGVTRQSDRLRDRLGMVTKP